MTKPDLVTIELIVRVPRNMTAAEAKTEIADNWYGPVYCSKSDTVLKPRWGKSRKKRGVTKGKR